MVRLRRILIFVAFTGAAIAMLVTNNPLLLLVIMPVVLMIYTDNCPRCGRVLFFARDTLGSWLNPLHVPEQCDSCGTDLISLDKR